MRFQLRGSRRCFKPKLGTFDDMNWQKQEIVVQANVANATVVFISTTDGAYGVTVDDFSLVPCDPPAKAKH
jgi:hypothetical protein